MEDRDRWIKDQIREMDLIVADRQRWIDRLKSFGYFDVPNLVEAAPAHAG